MNKLITLTKAALVGSLLVSAVTGCSLFGNKSCCCPSGCEKKTSGINTSMSVGVGTDGLSIGSESNIGSHGASGSISTH